MSTHSTSTSGRSRASDSSVGWSARQGGHQAAVNSTSTSGAELTSSSKRASVVERRWVVIVNTPWLGSARERRICVIELGAQDLARALEATAHGIVREVEALGDLDAARALGGEEEGEAVGARERHE